MGISLHPAGHRPPKDAPADQAEVRQPSSQQVSVASPVPRPAQLDRKWIIAIDAGHGGKDPGALGQRGTKEKDITLAAAKQLASDLNKTGRVSARLIRSSDKFLKLRQRIAIARDMGADIFISLHADSAPGSQPEAYLFSPFQIPHQTRKQLISPDKRIRLT